MSVDHQVLEFFVRNRHPALTSAARVITNLGSSAVVIPVVIVAGLVGRWRRRTWTALVLLAGAYAGGELLFQVLKSVVQRPRPPAALALGHFTGTAFPSGHATLSVAVWGMLAALVAGAARAGAAKAAAWAAAAVTAATVGVTRLYLAAHWLTDVLAGWALGGLWLAAVLAAAGRLSWLRAATSSRSASP